MAFDSSFPKAVGFVLNAGFVPGGEKRTPLGTFFLLQFQTSDGEPAVVAVTSRHVIEAAREPTGRIRTISGRVIETPFDNWRVARDETVDLALHQWNPGSIDDGDGFTAIDAEQAFERIGQTPRAGVTVYMAGLLHEEGSLATAAIPVVKSASVAAWRQPELRWITKYPPRALRWRTSYGHLIDVRSWGGFSGSPCFLQFQVPGPRRRELPAEWAAMAEEAGNDPSQLGEIHTFTIWIGVFAADYEQSGIGIVVPTESVFSIIDSPVPYSPRAIG